MIYIGIDPGKFGALAIINGNKVETVPYNKKVYSKTLEKYANLPLSKCRCVVEHVHSMPNQGVKSTFNFGRNFGYIIGLLEGYNIKYHLVASLKWKNFYNLTGKGKQASIDLVHKKFITANLRKTNRSKGDDHNLAEAVLLANYGKSLSEGDFNNGE